MKKVSVSFLGVEDSCYTIKKLNESSCDYIHFDVMDGKFVKNKFLTPKELAALINLSKKKNDVHLMVDDPIKYIEELALLDVFNITVHCEVKDYIKYIDIIKSYGFNAGVSIKPDTNILDIFPILDRVDLVLIMSVNPGASGQKFIYDTEEKIKKLKQEIVSRGLNVKISVDGGINADVLKMVSLADVLVSSSFVLKDLNNIEVLKNV